METGSGIPEIYGRGKRFREADEKLARPMRLRGRRYQLSKR